MDLGIEFTILTGAIFVGLGVFVICSTISAFARGSAASDWILVYAKILRSRAKEDRDGKWVPDIAYEYTIEGQTFESAQVGPIPIAAASQEEIRRLTQRYLATEQVMVYVNPANYADALLDRTPSWTQTLRRIVLGLVFVGVGGYAILREMDFRLW